MPKKKTSKKASRRRRNVEDPFRLDKDEVVVLLTVFDSDKDLVGNYAGPPHRSSHVMGIFDSWQNALKSANAAHRSMGYDPSTDLDDMYFNPSGFRFSTNVRQVLKDPLDFPTVANPEERRTKTQTIKVRDDEGKLRKITDAQRTEAMWKTAAGAALGGIAGFGFGVPLAFAFPALGIATMVAGAPVGAYLAKEYWVPEKVAELQGRSGTIGAVLGLASSWFLPGGILWTSAAGAALGTYLGLRPDDKSTKNNPYMARQYRHLSKDEVEELEDLLVAGQQAKVQAELARSRGDRAEARRHDERYRRLEQRMLQLEERLRVEGAGKIRMNPGRKPTAQNAALKRKLMR